MAWDASQHLYQDVSDTSDIASYDKYALSKYEWEQILQAGLKNEEYHNFRNLISH